MTQPMVPPILSLVIPCFNVETYIETLLSRLREDMANDEIIRQLEIVFVEDSSNDQTGALLTDFAKEWPHVRVITNVTNSGIGESRRIGADLSRGRYVWFIDSDDSLGPGTLLSVINSALVASDEETLLLINRISHVTPHETLRLETSNFPVGTRIDKRVFLHSVLSGEIATVMWNQIWRREALNGKLSGARFNEDIESILRLSSAITACRVIDGTYLYMHRPGSLLGTTNFRRRLDSIQRISKVWEEIPLQLRSGLGVFYAKNQSQRLLHAIWASAKTGNRLVGEEIQLLKQMSDRYHLSKRDFLAAGGAPRDWLLLELVRVSPGLAFSTFSLASKSKYL